MQCVFFFAELAFILQRPALYYTSVCDCALTMAAIRTSFIVSILSVVVSVSATSADRHISAASFDEHDRPSQDAFGRGDLIDGYLKQFQNRAVWEVLASHGVQVYKVSL